MSVVEGTAISLEALGVVTPRPGEHLCRVDQSRIVDVIRTVTANGQRLVIEDVSDSDEVTFSVIEAYVGPTADTAENLPPQCSF